MHFFATHCNSCGKEYKKSMPKWMVVVALLGALMVGVLVGMPYSSKNVTPKSNQVLEIEKRTASRIALQAFLKDPASSQIRNHKGNCGEVNSKNSFGGYTGFKRFIASSAIVVIEGENMDSDKFQKAWEQVCK